MTCFNGLFFYILVKSIVHLPSYYHSQLKEVPTCVIELPSKRQKTILKLFYNAIEEDSISDKSVDIKMAHFLVELLVNCLNFERQKTLNPELLEVIASTVSILSWCSSLEKRPDLKEILLRKGLVQVSLKILERYPAKATPLKDLNLNYSGSSPDMGMKCHLMKIIANLSYNSVECQELIRTEGGIPTILNHFVIDNSNPFLREWSILTIRNITENNVQNQEVIAALEFQELPQTMVRELETIGLDAKVTDGKLKLTKKSVDGNNSPPRPGKHLCTSCSK